MASAALRSFSRRRNLSPKWFFCKTSSSAIPSLVLHHHHDVKDYNTKPTTFSYASLLLARSFNRQVFLFEDRKKMSFGQPLGGASSGVFLCSRQISFSSRKPAEESSIKLDALGDIVEGLVPAEKSVEAVAAATSIDGCSSTAAFENLYSPLNCVHYVINGIHELTGFNWWMSVVLTAFLVNGLMFPLSMRIQRQVWELKILGMSIQRVRRVMQTCDPKSMAKHKKWEAECTQKFGEFYMSGLPLSLLNLFITIIFINGINTMAKQIPGFANGGILWFTGLSTLDSFYIFPLLTGLTFWYTSKVPTISLTKIISRVNEVPLYCIFFFVLQAAFKYEPAVYFYVIPYKISLYTLTWMCRSKQIAKLSKELGVPYVPVTSSEQQRIMARVVRVMREFIDEVKKKKDKK